jgi:hypothetical protein
LYSPDQEGLPTLPQSGSAMSGSPLEQMILLARLKSMISQFAGNQAGAPARNGHIPFPPGPTGPAQHIPFPPMTPPAHGHIPFQPGLPGHIPFPSAPSAEHPAIPLMQASPRRTLENIARAKAVATTMQHLRKLRPYQQPGASPHGRI